MMPMMTPTVGVAPGTTTIQLGACAPDPRRWMAWERTHDLAAMQAADPTVFTNKAHIASLRAAGVAGSSFRVVDPRLAGLGVVDTRARIRWDLIAAIGGGSLLIALTTGLLASAIGRRR